MALNEVASKLNKYKILGRSNWEVWHNGCLHSFGGNVHHPINLWLSLGQAEHEVRQLERDVATTPTIDKMIEKARSVVQYADDHDHPDDWEAPFRASNGELRMLIQEWERVKQILEREGAKP